MFERPLCNRFCGKLPQMTPKNVLKGASPLAHDEIASKGTCAPDRRVMQVYAYAPNGTPYLNLIPRKRPLWHAETQCPPDQTLSVAWSGGGRDGIGPSCCCFAPQILDFFRSTLPTHYSDDRAIDFGRAIPGFCNAVTHYSSDKSVCCAPQLSNRTRICGSALLLPPIYIGRIEL